jgi:hypothetical protein
MFGPSIVVAGYVQSNLDSLRRAEGLPHPAHAKLTALFIRVDTAAEKRYGGAGTVMINNGSTNTNRESAISTSRNWLCVLLALGPLSPCVQAQALLRESKPIPGSVAASQSVRPAGPDSITIAYTQYLWPKVNGVATVYYLIDPASDPNAAQNIATAIGTFNADLPWCSRTSTRWPHP